MLLFGNDSVEKCILLLLQRNGLLALVHIVWVTDVRTQIPTT